MNNPIQAPTKGAPLKSAWGVAVTNGLNALQPFAAEGTLLSTVGGAGATPLPKNLRDRRNVSVVPPGCYDLVKDGEVTINKKTYPDYSFARQYRVDGKEIKAGSSAVKVSEGVLQGELQEGAEYTAGDKPYCYLESLAKTSENETSENETSDNIKFAKTIEELNPIIQDDPQRSITLLYKLTHYGTVAIDFRTMPRSLQNDDDVSVEAGTEGVEVDIDGEKKRIYIKVTQPEEDGEDEEDTNPGNKKYVVDLTTDAPDESSPEDEESKDDEDCCNKWSDDNLDGMDGDEDDRWSGGGLPEDDWSGNPCPQG